MPGAGHPLVEELCGYVFSVQDESLLRDTLILASAIFLYLPSTVVWMGKFFRHCAEQRKNAYYLRQPWLVQFIAIVVQQNSGGVVVYLLCDQTPRLARFTSFLLPCMFALWYGCHQAPGFFCGR